MSQVLIAKLTKSYIKEVPKLKTGYTVRVHQKIKEGDKERIQIFEGLVIKTNGSGIGRTLTVRKISEGVGVEKIFPIHSSNIEKIEVVKIAKVRRSKLYYMRERFGKSARLKERQISKEEQEALIQKLDKEEIIAVETIEKEEAAKTPVAEEVVETTTEEKVEAVVETPVEEEVVETPTESEATTEEDKKEA